MSVRTISESKYQDLVYAQAKLDSLEEMGVDNWDGYSEAMKLLNSWYDGSDTNKESLGIDASEGKVPHDQS